MFSHNARHHLKTAGFLAGLATALLMTNADARAATGAMAGNLAAVAAVKSTVKSTAIPVIGTSEDKKYKVYKIDGELSDVNYKAAGRVYTSGDLFGKMDYIQKADVNAHGYKCGFICKDRLENVVGINPNFAFLAPKK